MKLLTKLLIFTFLTTGTAFAQSWQHSTNVTDHDVYQGQSCVSWTGIGTYTVKNKTKELEAGLARVEILAQADKSGEFKEPLVQIVIAKGPAIPESYSAVVKLSQGTVTMDRILLDSAQKVVLVSRLDDRQKLIDSIKEMGQLDATLMVKTKAVASLSFSLKGSSKTVNQQINDCKLGFINYAPL